jgi:hypothetical protein
MRKTFKNIPLWIKETIKHNGIIKSFKIIYVSKNSDFEEAYIDKKTAIILKEIYGFNLLSSPENGITQKIHIVSSKKGDKFLRTDKNHILSDNLNTLPTYEML